MDVELVYQAAAGSKIHRQMQRLGLALHHLHLAAMARRSPRLANKAKTKSVFAAATAKRKTTASAASKKRRRAPSAKTATSIAASAKGGASRSRSSGPSRAHEREKWGKGFKLVAGVDEAGRGPLVGPVVAAACILHEDVDLEGINDSKKMTEDQRERCFEILTSNPKAVSYAWEAIDATTIDEINILQATMLAMETAVSKLPVKPDFVLIDGNRIPKGMDARTTEAIVKGDEKSLAIAAASVIAKVVRDRMMRDLHDEYPAYGFDKHKGYGVPQHLEAIKKHGPCPQHRRTFAPIKYM